MWFKAWATAAAETPPPPTAPESLFCRARLTYSTERKINKIKSSSPIHKREVIKAIAIFLLAGYCLYPSEYLVRIWRFCSSCSYNDLFPETRSIALRHFFILFKQRKVRKIEKWGLWTQVVKNPSPQKAWRNIILYFDRSKAGNLELSTSRQRSRCSEIAMELITF